MPDSPLDDKIGWYSNFQSILQTSKYCVIHHHHSIWQIRSTSFKVKRLCVMEFACQYCSWIKERITGDCWLLCTKGLDDMQMNGPSKVPWDALLAASFDGNSFFGLEWMPASNFPSGHPTKNRCGTEHRSYATKLKCPDISWNTVNGKRFQYVKWNGNLWPSLAYCDIDREIF